MCQTLKGMERSHKWQELKRFLCLVFVTCVILKSWRTVELQLHCHSYKNCKYCRFWPLKDNCAQFFWLISLINMIMQIILQKFLSQTHCTLDVFTLLVWEECILNIITSPVEWNGGVPLHVKKNSDVLSISMWYRYSDCEFNILHFLGSVRVFWKMFDANKMVNQ